ncbi:CD1845 family protein [uncultured Clostridium sp.]|uniref:CD1845 family protein n=1 Tax=uncultured Clostridium sp. TaxID=59620 RepID=UPI0025EC941B|nr:CD1845 family protein [uncultured Clostridium sp.]
MRLIFKIFALPFLLVLSLLAAVLMFLFDVAGWFLSLASGVLAVIAVGLFVLQHQLVGGVAFLVLAFLLSPYGLPAIAEFLIGLLDELNYSLRRFITS